MHASANTAGLTQYAGWRRNVEWGLDSDWKYFYISLEHSIEFKSSPHACPSPPLSYCMYTVCSMAGWLAGSMYYICMYCMDGWIHLPQKPQKATFLLYCCEVNFPDEACCTALFKIHLIYSLFLWQVYTVSGFCTDLHAKKREILPA